VIRFWKLLGVRCFVSALWSALPCQRSLECAALSALFGVRCLVSAPLECAALSALLYELALQDFQKETIVVINPNDTKALTRQRTPKSDSEKLIAPLATECVMRARVIGRHAA
jgi:hypothetical protein